MGQQISAVPNPNGPLMRTRVKLTCDAPDHNVLIPAGEWEAVGDDFIAIRALATKRGWRRIDGGEWRGPCCHGGKTARDDA